MTLYSLIIENKWMLEVLYALLISTICTAIVFKTDKFFRLSLHTGIRYFRNAFLFFGAAFAARYIFGVFSDMSVDYSYLIRIIFEYLLVMAGFFLFYSLIWKKIESTKESYASSLFNAKIAIFHIIALIIAVLDNLWQTYYFMFLSQVIIFSYASIIAYINYKKDENKHRFLRFYFVAMLLGLTAWFLNLLAASYFQWNPGILINIGIINVIFFLLFLYGIVKVTQKNGNKKT